MRKIIAACLTTALLLTIGATTISGQSLDLVTQPNAGCSAAQQQTANRLGGNCHDWHVIRDGFGNFVGAKFKSNSDKRIKGPRSGSLDIACGRLWSTQKVTRSIWISVATYWVNGKRSNLCTTPRTPAMAKRLLVKSGDASAVRIEGSESTGWIIKANGNVVLKTVYHGRVDSPDGSFQKGHQPPPLVVGEQATFWYNG